MKERAARYLSSKNQKGESDAILVAYVARTPKGKIRLKRIAIRLRGRKEEPITELPPNDPRYVFESDYKVRKSAHDATRRSGRFSAFYDSSTRVIYDES
jgi:hypothetical protein